MVGRSKEKMAPPEKFWKSLHTQNNLAAVMKQNQEEVDGGYSVPFQEGLEVSGHFLVGLPIGSVLLKHC
jgi:hypothetical protein